MPEGTTNPGATQGNTAGATPANNTTQQQSAQQGQQSQTGSGDPVSFEDWLKGQDETVKGLIGQRFEALHNTVKATRTERDELSKQVRDAAKKLEEGSEARKTLDELSGQLVAANQRADFFEEAAKPEIGCTNPKLALLGAQEIGAIDQKGRINWDAVRAAFPELFRKTTPAGNAGAGTGAMPAGKSGMNDFIRKAAGR